MSSWSQMYYVNKDGLDFLILLPLLHKCRDYRHVPSSLVLCGTDPGTQGFTQSRQALYQLSYIPSCLLFLRHCLSLNLSCAPGTRLLPCSSRATGIHSGPDSYPEPQACTVSTLLNHPLLLLYI